jgi:ABC-type Fe3+-hydroxamate transport system substrate-binding protein
MKLLLTLLLLVAPAMCFASRNVTDELGRTVVVPDHPHRLICLAPSIVDDVYSLGAGPDVIAVSEYTAYPEEAAKKPTIGAPLNPSLEKIVAMHPDLVLGTGGMNHMPAVDLLERYGIPVFMVDPHGIAGIYKSITSLGHALNRDSDAASLLGDLQEREHSVAARVQGKPATRVFMPVWYDPIVTIGKHAFITELIEAAGGSSITSDIAQEWPQVSLEAVIARHAEAVLLIKGSKVSLAELSTRAGWEAMSAVREKRVYFVDRRIELSSPAAIYAMEDLAKQLHP